MRIEIKRKDVELISPYTYSRSRDLKCTLVHVELHNGEAVGRGEGAPFESFFEAPASETLEQLHAVAGKVHDRLTPEELLTLLPPGPARNALDAALWDLEAKRRKKRVWQLLDLPEPRPVRIMYTISMAEHDQLVRELEDARRHPILKLKLGSKDDLARLELTRRIRPEAELVVDVNSGWDIETLRAMLPVLERYGVKMVEQPVAPRYEAGLREVERSIPLIADESFSSLQDLGRLADLYDGVNIKLDKCGGLTTALKIIEEARRRKLSIMLGCLPASSLSSAVGMLAAQFAKFVDLDNQFWLKEDIQPALAYENGWLHPASPELWG